MSRKIPVDVLEVLVSGVRVTPGPGLRERVLKSAVKPGWEPWRGRVAALWDLDEERVQEEFDRSGRGDEWSATPFPGVMAFHLGGGPATAGADVGLVRIPAGFGFPLHTHSGTEEYVVLQGTMRFVDGHREGPGDRVRNDGTVSHAYTAEGEVVVAAVVRGELVPGWG